MTYSLDRRAALFSLAGFVGTLALGSGRVRAQGQRRSTPQIVDISHGPFLRPSGNLKQCTREIEGFYKNLADRGVETVIRYFSGYHPGQPINNFYCKNISSHEREIVHGHGLSLAVVYQLNGRAAGRYTRENGLRDAKFCLDRAKEINQPDGSAIYFGIDANTERHPLGQVEAYFKAVSETFQGRFAVGCYGAGAHSKRVVPRYAKYSWIAEAQAWAGTRDYLMKGDWTFYQSKTEVDFSNWTKPYKVQIDTNIMNPKFDTIGAFHRDGSTATYKRNESEFILSRRMWVKSIQLNIFDTPSGRVIGRVCSAKLLHVLQIQNGWAQIDIDEDGQGDGFCEQKLLLPFSQMPEWRSGCAAVDI